MVPALVVTLALASAASPAAAGPSATQNPTPTPPVYAGHGVESTSPETLARFAPRPIDAELRRRIQAALDLRAPGSGLVASDGQRLYFNWTVTGISQVWRLDGPERFPVQLTGGEDATALAGITPDGRWLVVSRDRKGEEDPGLYLLAPEGGVLRPIQHKKGVQTALQWLADDSSSLWYSANDIDRASYALYRYDLATGKATLAFSEPGLWSIRDARPDGRFLLGRSVGSRWTEFWEWNPATGEKRPLLGVDEKEEYQARYAAVDGELLVLTPRFGEWRRLYRLRAGEWLPVTPEQPMDVAGFDIDLARSRIRVVWNDRGYRRVAAWDARSLATIALPELPAAEQVSWGSTSRNGRYSELSVESTRSPAQSWVLDWTTGKLVRWLLPSAPEVDLATFAVPALESYPARDGTAIPMFVRRPARCASEPCPVVVQFHGGPESQALPRFSPVAQLYVDAGFVFVEPNVRGSDGYGKAWFHADDGRRRLDVITDIEDAALHIRKAWARDGRAPRIGILGGSYGGYSTLMGMTRFAGAYDAGVSSVGISSFLTFLRNTAPYRRILRVTEYGDPDTDRDALTQLSPLTWLERIAAPLLLIQGANDPRVPVGEAVQMHDAMVRRGLPGELVIFPDEGHGARKRENQALQIGYALQFFGKHLVPAAAPAR